MIGPPGSKPTVVVKPAVGSPSTAGSADTNVYEPIVEMRSGDGTLRRLQDRTGLATACGGSGSNGSSWPGFIGYIRSSAVGPAGRAWDPVLAPEPAAAMADDALGTWRIAPPHRGTADAPA